MGFFDWFARKRPIATDAVFGELTFDRGCWSGWVDFPGSADPIAVSIDAGERGPTNEHQRSFQELKNRYRSLHAELAEALWALYQPMLSDVRQFDSLGKLSSPAAILQATTLDAVHVAAGGTIRLLYGFTPDIGWDDAMFTIEFDGSKLIPISLDD